MEDAEKVKGNMRYNTEAAMKCLGCKSDFLFYAFRSVRFVHRMCEQLENVFL